MATLASKVARCLIEAPRILARAEHDFGLVWVIKSRWSSQSIVVLEADVEDYCCKGSLCTTIFCVRDGRDARDLQRSVTLLQCDTFNIYRNLCELNWSARLNTSLQERVYLRGVKVGRVGEFEPRILHYMNTAQIILLVSCARNCVIRGNRWY